MCGIVGYMDLRGEGRIDRKILVRMTDTITYQGPDSSGYFAVHNVGLGFRRLSVVDVVSKDQPIYNEDGSIVLICNAEIHNCLELKQELIHLGHTFTTNSAVEVLLHLYEEEGEEFVKQLNGQFAFALFDRKKSTMLLARDHSGINPLFYTVVDGFFIFASEMKAILAHPAVISPRTVFRGVSSLKAGHRITVNRERVAVEEYWDSMPPAEVSLSHSIS